ncbi:uncharacterized protein AMSG_01100 [Thecamonas trahens ATCC 50062]|uniref:Uncharacterized protein n=1 Tax=Thecamonas trahens ATCC 50062 TaxID=461836 RepID=A0A0L0DLJ6_THETB|nr:hypothetical protein AMSG_01100 [Thecamonas trahens ATCC 50062]KNC52273.1 hypothetical protein AMSG_01100 [Thecamonas trahens ATCC 50062]|eukprot:XP_013762272.1 hypothetical protein AMSG_01100 [Thecamonas trahens ATCC 50062]
MALDVFRREFVASEFRPRWFMATGRALTGNGTAMRMGACVRALMGSGGKEERSDDDGGDGRARGHVLRANHGLGLLAATRLVISVRIFGEVWAVDEVGRGPLFVLERCTLPRCVRGVRDRVAVRMEVASVFETSCPVLVTATFGSRALVVHELDGGRAECMRALPAEFGRPPAAVGWLNAGRELYVVSAAAVEGGHKVCVAVYGWEPLTRQLSAEPAALGWVVAHPPRSRVVWDGVDDDGVIEVRSSAGSQFYAASDVVAALRDARSSEVFLGGEHGLAPLAELALSGARVTGMPPFQFSDSMCAAGGPSGVVLATSRTGDRGPIAARVADLGSDPGVGPNLFADAPGWSAQMGFDMSAFFLFSGRRVLSRTYSCIKVFDVAACGPAMTAAPPLPSITTAAELVRSKSSGLAPMEVVDRRQSRDESGKDSLEVRMRFAVSAVEVSDVVRRVREREAASRLSDDGGEAAAEVGLYGDLGGRDGRRGSCRTRATFCPALDWEARATQRSTRWRLRRTSG